MPIIPNSLNRNMWVRRTDGSLPPQQDTPVAASQTLGRFDFVVLSTGLIAEAIALSGTDHAAAGADAGTGALALYGMTAAEKTTGAAVTDTDRVPVFKIDDSTEFILPMYHDTASSAEPQDLTIGAAYDLVRVQLATGIGVYAANIAVSNSDSELIYQGYYGSNIAEDYGFGVFKVKAANIAR